MADLLLTVLEALQLVALVPCAFVALYLLFAARPRANAVVPVMYFVLLSASFFLQLHGLWDRANHPTIYGALVFAESLQPAVCFLLIMQLLTGRVPKPVYWLILALPVIGGSSLVYGTITAQDICLASDYCVTAASAQTLYAVFSASMIFLLLIVQFSHQDIAIDAGDVNRSHKYWLVISLVGLNLLSLVMDLGLLAGKFAQKDVWLSATVLRITFIYLVLTSLFRVFDRYAPSTVSVVDGRKKPEETDQQLLAKITSAMETHGIYREMGFNREAFAKHVGITEHQLSRIVNGSFGKNINEFVNGFRIEEAKKRLSSEPTSITVIAFEVGFNSIASFNRVFKEMMGCSPTEYRANASGAQSKTA